MANRTLTIAALIAGLLTGLAACGDQVAPDAPPGDRTDPEPARAPEAAPTGSARVVETMDAGTYTYVLAEKASGRTWWAAPRFDVSVGDTVELPANGGMAMRGFESKTLGRRFDLIYFAQAIRRTGGPAANVVRDAHRGGPPPAAGPAAGQIEKPEGGLTVQEIHQRGKDLAGEDVLLRGKVVKYNAGIMDRNWLHVRDGTGAAGTNDITVTTKGKAAVGDTVLVRGRLVADRDLGHGYKFALIIEDAKIEVE